jgi:hypothetical protein
VKPDVRLDDLDAAKIWLVVDDSDRLTDLNEFVSSVALFEYKSA